MKRLFLDNYGRKVETIGNCENIRFDDLINDKIEYKKISLVLSKGISSFLKRSLQSNDFTSIRNRYAPNIEIFFDVTSPMDIYLDKKREDKLGVIEINVADIAISLFKDVLNTDKNRFMNEYNLEDIRQEAAEVAYLNDNLKESLVSEVQHIIKTIDKYENVIDILVGVSSDAIIQVTDDINPLESYSVAQLSKLWCMTDSNIRMAIKNNKFNNAKLEKVGKTWLIPYEEMCNVFGDFALCNIQKTLKRLCYQKHISKQEKNVLYQKGQYLASLKHVYYFDYIDFKRQLVEAIQQDDLTSIHNILKQHIIVDDILDSIVSEYNFMQMLLVLESYVSCTNNKLEANEQIVKTYVACTTALNTLYKDIELGDTYLSLIKEFNFKIYGLTQSDLDYDCYGVEIGNISVTHYNVQYANYNYSDNDLWYAMDDKSQLSSDIYNLLYNKCCHKDYIGINENILCIEDLYIEPTLCSPNLIKDVIQNISSDIELLFNLTTGVITAPIDNDIYYNCYTELGFNIERYNDFTIAVFNNDYIMGKISAHNDEIEETNSIIESIQGISFAVEFEGVNNIKCWKTIINHREVKLTLTDNLYWSIAITNPNNIKLSIPTTMLLHVSSKEEAFNEAMKYMSMDEDEFIVNREPSRIKVKVKCIKDFISNDNLIFEKDTVYRAIDSGCQLLLNKNNCNYIIASNNYGNWKEDMSFNKYFCLI